MVTFELTGMMATPTTFNESDQSTWNMKDIGRKGLHRNVDESTRNVTYTYYLHEYRGLEDYPSTDKFVRSSSTCKARTTFQNDVYENGMHVGTISDGKCSPRDRLLHPGTYKS
jgi:hypothetical protein